MNIDSITYHKASLKDVQLLIDLRIEFMVEFTGPQSNESVIEFSNYLKEYFNRSLSNGSCIFYLAKSGESYAGTGGMIIREQPGNFRNPTGKVGYLLNMYTLPSFRRKGICTAILKMLIEDGRKAGIKSFELHATKEGEPVYRNNGFHIHGEPTYRRYF